MAADFIRIASWTTSMGLYVLVRDVVHTPKDQVSTKFELWTPGSIYTIIVSDYDNDGVLTARIRLITDSVFVARDGWRGAALETSLDRGILASSVREVLDAHLVSSAIGTGRLLSYGLGCLPYPFRSRSFIDGLLEREGILRRIVENTSKSHSMTDFEGLVSSIAISEVRKRVHPFVSHIFDHSTNSSPNDDTHYSSFVRLQKSHSLEITLNYPAWLWRVDISLIDRHSSHSTTIVNDTDNLIQGLLDAKLIVEDSPEEREAYWQFMMKDAPSPDWACPAFPSVFETSRLLGHDVLTRSKDDQFISFLEGSGLLGPDDLPTGQNFTGLWFDYATFLNTQRKQLS